MKKVSKKDLRKSIEHTLRVALEKLKVGKGSKKTQKAMKEASRKLAETLKADVLKAMKKDKKAGKRVEPVKKKVVHKTSPKKVKKVTKKVSPRKKSGTS